MKFILDYLILTCNLFANSKIDLNGSLEKNITLGKTTLGTVHLSHKIKTYAPEINQAKSAWTCDFLTSYVGPEGRKGIQWVMQGGKV